MKSYTYEQVKNESAGSSTLFVIRDNVYDVTAFLNEHPGGEEVLLDHNGIDATEDFNDVGHSSDALELMTKYQVGEIIESERRNLPAKQGWKAGNADATTGGDDNATYTILAGAIVTLLAVLYFYVL